MADRPTASTSRVGRPRTRSQSVHLPTRIPIASKAVGPRTKSVQKTQVKDKGEGTVKGKSARKKSGKAVIIVGTDSEDLEVDFPHYSLNQPQDIPAEQPQEPNPPVNITAEEPQVPNHPLDVLAEGPGEPREPQQPVNIPAEGSRRTTGTK